MSGRPPFHLPFIAAASVGLYSCSLALITALQAEHDARLAVVRQPIADAAAQATSERERATEAIRAAAASLADASDGYAATSEASATLDAALLVLAQQVSRATGAAARLPATVQLPAPLNRVVQVVTAPPTQATTGASGR